MSLYRTAVPRKSFGRRAQPEPVAPLRPPVSSQRDVMKPPEPERVPPIDAVVDVAEPVDFEPGELIGRSFAVMGRNAVTFLALMAAAAIPGYMGHSLLGENILASLLVPMLTLFSCLALYTAIFRRAMASLANETASFSDCLQAVQQTSAQAYTAIAITVLAVWFLAIVPWIGAAADRALTAPVAILEEKGWNGARARSKALVAPCRARVRMLMLLLAVLAVSRAIAPVSGGPDEVLPAFLFGDWLFPLLLTAFTATASAVLYWQLAHGEVAPQQDSRSRNSQRAPLAI